ncbi:MAG: fused MFS/spermidine synthase, partial [Candidatus Anstonellales archaeon]
AFNLRKKESYFNYIHTLKSIVLLNPFAKTTLILGLGGGNLASDLIKKNFNVDACEINKAIIEAAKKYFYLNKKVNIYFGDCRVMLSKLKKKYDYIVLDSYTAEKEPYYLYSLEAFKNIKKALNKNGIFAINAIGYVKGKHAQAMKSIYLTLSKLFKFIEVYGTQKTEKERNLIFFASNTPLVFKNNFKTLTFKEKKQILQLLNNKIKIKTNKKTFILTDNYNPLDILNVKHQENWRKLTIKNVHLGILLF